MSDIFLSYASKDRNRIYPLVSALEAQGWTVFWDRAISTGQTWHDILSNELDTSSCVVVTWTQHSIRSRWVYEEAEEGRKRGALFPVILDKEAILPLGFRVMQSTDLSQWSGERDCPAFLQLVEEITAYFAGCCSRDSPPIPADNTSLTILKPPAAHDAVSSSSPQATTIITAAIDDTILQKARYQLACYLGPIAGVLVKKAAKQTTTVKQLVQLLATELTDEKQRADFIRRMKS